MTREPPLNGVGEGLRPSASASATSFAQTIRSWSSTPNTWITSAQPRLKDPVSRKATACPNTRGGPRCSPAPEALKLEPTPGSQLSVEETELPGRESLEARQTGRARTRVPSTRQASMGIKERRARSRYSCASSSGSREKGNGFRGRSECKRGYSASSSLAISSRSSWPRLRIARRNVRGKGCHLAPRLGFLLNPLRPIEAVLKVVHVPEANVGVLPVQAVKGDELVEHGVHVDTRTLPKIARRRGRRSPPDGRGPQKMLSGNDSCWTSTSSASRRLKRSAS